MNFDHASSSVIQPRLSRGVAIVLTAALLGCATEELPAEPHWGPELDVAWVESRSPARGGGPVLLGLELAPRECPDDATLLAALQRPDEVRMEPAPARPWLALGPANDLLVVGAGDLVELWRFERGSRRRTLLDSQRAPWTVAEAAWRPDGAALVTRAEHGRLGCWSLIAVDGRPALRLVRTKDEGAAAAIGLAFAPNGALLVLDTKGGLARWRFDPQAGLLLEQQLGALTVASEGQGVVAVSPDGRLAFAGRGSAGEVWALGKAPARLGQAQLDDEAPLGCAAFSADGRRLALAGGGAAQEVVTLLDVGSAKPTNPRTVLAYRPGRAPLPVGVERVAFLEDDLVVVTARSIERLRPGSSTTVVDALRCLELLAPAVTADGRRIVDATLRAWEVVDAPHGIAGGEPPPALPTDYSSVPPALEVTPEGELLVAERGEVRRARSVREAGTGRLLTPFARGAGGPVACSPDGRLLVTGSWGGRTAQAWAREAGGAVRPLHELSARVEAATFTPDGRWLVTAGDDELVVWQVADGRLERLDALEVDTGWVRSLCAGGDRVVLCGVGLTCARVRDDGRLEVLARWEPCDAAALSADGRFLLTTPGGREPARLWQLATGADGGLLRKQTALLGPEPAEHVALSRDGAFAATSHFEGGRLWQLDPKGGLPSSLGALPACTGPLVFAPDGAVLLELSGDEVAAWRVYGGQEVRVGDATLRWDRPRGVPEGTPRLRVAVERTDDTLTVAVSNDGDAPAFEVRGQLAYDRDDLPLGGALPIAVGTVAPGETVTRLMDPPRGDGLLLRRIDWGDRFGRAPPPTVLDDSPRPPLPVRRRVLREAGRLALELRREHERDWRVDLRRVAVALARDGDLLAARQLAGVDPSTLPYPPPPLSAVQSALARGDLEGALAAAADEPYPSGRAAGLLEVAEVRARRGDLAGARIDARRTTRFRAWSWFWPEETIAFDPFVPERWCMDLDRSAFSVFSPRQVVDVERLPRAAAALHVRLGLADPHLYLAAFDRQRVSPAQACAIAAGHTSVAGPEAALAWVERLRDRRTRVAALTGVGEALFGR